MVSEEERIDIKVPRWSQDTFYGRFMHFWSITDWRNGLSTEQDLDNAKLLLDAYR